MAGYEIDPCEKCEEVMQPYLDRVLERRRACARPRSTSTAARYCAQALPLRGEPARSSCAKCCDEEMPPELKQKLASLSTPSS